MKPNKCGFADFEYIFNWVIDMMKKFMQGELYDEKRIKFIRDTATTIFISYEKELIGKTNKPAYKQETLDKIINCREKAIDLLDKFGEHKNSGNDMGNNLQSIRDELKKLNK